jgi:drug/metabolite transporter (DMT)-like permease
MRVGYSTRLTSFRQTLDVIAILGGFGAAFMWASSTLTSSRAGRLIPASSILAWMMVVGLVIATPLAIASGPVPHFTPTLIMWMLGSGFGNVVGLLFVYRGLRVGKVGVVAALASTEGAIAAVISVATGEGITVPVAIILLVIVVGIAVVALASDKGEAAEPAYAEPASTAALVEGANPAVSTTGPLAKLNAEQQAIFFGSLGALCFGVCIYSTGKLGSDMPALMAVMPARVVGVIGVFIPLLLAGKLHMTRAAVPMVVLIGAAEVFGNASYIVGAGQSIAISAVLASQFAAIAAVAAFFLFRERLSVSQRYGVVAIAVGVAVLTLARS